jgi:excisionase family DNA binding protein
VAVQTVVGQPETKAENAPAERTATRSITDGCQLRYPTSDKRFCTEKWRVETEIQNEDRKKSLGMGGAAIQVPEIARRLGVGRLKVYAMLEDRIIPGIRVGRKWIVTRYAYEQWERTCGAPSSSARLQ